MIQPNQDKHVKAKEKDEKGSTTDKAKRHFLVVVECNNNYFMIVLLFTVLYILYVLFNSIKFNTLI